MLKIILLSIAAAVSYGVVHDQITAHLCVEYFSVAHPPVFPTEDPTLLALGWGIIATWWVGLILGIPLALAARLGPWPKRSTASLVRPLMWLMVASAIVAVASGLTGWMLAHSGHLKLSDFDDYLAVNIPPAHHAVFFADAFSHLASYAMGFLGGIFIIASVTISRYRNRQPPSTRLCFSR